MNIGGVEAAEDVVTQAEGLKSTFQPHDVDRRTRRTRRSRWPLVRFGIQVCITVVFLLAWQFLPKVDWLSERYKFLNKFFISSPTDVFSTVARLTVGDSVNGFTLWPYLKNTIYSSVVGVLIGLALGALAGLIFSNFLRASEVVRPFIVICNSVPRVALIPIFVVIAGPTTKASVLSVVAVVFFLGFFNAFEGGSKVRQAVLDNAKLLGASPFATMRFIRLPQVLSWTFAAVPNAISFGLIVAVTTELIAGVQGMGTLLQQSMVNLDVALTFAVIVVLSVAGLIMYGLANLLRDVLLRWEEKGQ